MLSLLTVTAISTAVIFFINMLIISINSNFKRTGITNVIITGVCIRSATISFVLICIIEIISTITIGHFSLHSII